MKSKKNFFNQMAEKWDKDDKVSPEKYRRIISEIKIKKGQNVLDVGTGTGVLIPYLLEIEKEINIFAIDIAEKMIEKFREKNYPPNVKSFVMDIKKTIFNDNFFDIIIANACYPHFEEKATALKEIYRLLKKGGIFIISHPTGRKFVNELHRKTHPLIAKDKIGSISEMKKFIENFGFRFIKGIDEDDFFLISFTK